MTHVPCSSNAPAHCRVEKRRAMVRASEALAGIDYVEVSGDGKSLTVHFFGHLPPGLSVHHVVIEGGERIRDIHVWAAEIEEHEDGDSCLRVTVDKKGDFSTYCLCLIEPAEVTTRCSYDEPPPVERKASGGIDPRYACAEFSFRLDCPSPLDCKPAPCIPEPPLPLPAIDYLAGDFASFKRLILDRLALTMPDWRERHVPDLGITIIEVMAYVADQLSYMKDAVATEAYLGTARRRISVRRHARLVDCRMHEGCNARTWVTLESDADVLQLRLDDLAFAAPSGNAATRAQGFVDWNELKNSRGAKIFEPIDIYGHKDDEGWPVIDVVAAHSEIHFYTWGNEECCLPAGTRRATLVDQFPTREGSTSTVPPCDPDAADAPDEERRLKLKEGDVLILEEIRGPRTGATADADPAKRHAIRLTRVTPACDPLTGIRVLEVEWCVDDALPFDLCLSARTSPPECELVETAVARGNVLLVGHGATREEENDIWIVQTETTEACCLCEGSVIEVHPVSVPLTIEIEHAPVTWSDTSNVGSNTCAGALQVQDPRSAVACISLDAAPPLETCTKTDEAIETKGPCWQNQYAWKAVLDLLASGPNDLHFVVENDDEGRSFLRFGDGDCGRQPEPGWRFRARYRIGNGKAGNVGRDAIVWIAKKSGPLSGVTLRPRNPLPASGGTDPEPVAEVKLFAPHAYSRVLARAVAASDYAEIAAQDARVESAHAELAWTGSWYEVNVALDPFARAAVDPTLADQTMVRLEKVRRIGHDLRIVQAREVPLVITIYVCVDSGYRSGDVARALVDSLSNRRLPSGQLGLFHPDALRFGTDIAASRVISIVQQTEGVKFVELKYFARQDADDADAAKSLADGIIQIAADEIAQLDNDPNAPERGTLTITLKGGI